MGKRQLLLFTMNLAFLTGIAQVRVGKLIIRSHQIYDMGQSDIVVADTLVMMDSSTIKLNKLKHENYIRAQVAIIGNNCIIDGKGFNGSDGRKGRDGDTPIGPCRDGENARSGGKGLDGGNGINLFLYLEELTLKGKWYINLSGGNGGDGGHGGNGGGGSPGTIHCQGGNGGSGGNGGPGGNGGNGGVLTINCLKCGDVRTLINKEIMLLNGGGNIGSGGFAGYGGAPGLAPDRNNGMKGIGGKDGSNGKPGEKGGLNFEIN